MIIKNNIYKSIVSVFLLFATNVVFAELFTVTVPNSVTAIINGKEVYLNPGDQFESGTVEGWKRNIKIIKSSNPKIRIGDAIIGNTRFSELLDDQDIEKNSYKYKLNKSIEILDDNGKKYFLKTGDVIEAGELNGWKRSILISSSQEPSVKEGKYYIGEKTFADLSKTNAMVMLNEKNEMPSVSELDSFVELLLKSDNDKNNNEEIIDEQEESMSFECPKAQKTFKLNKSISIVKNKGKQDVVPEGTIVNTIKTEKGICYFKIQKFPNGSNFDFTDFPEYLATYPANLSPENLEDYSSEKKINLDRGIVFSPNDGIEIKAIGRKTGKAYTFNKNDKIKIKGIHPSGAYIVTRNNERFEYRIDPSELDELNESGAIDISLEDTVSELTANNSFNVVVEEDDCKSCSAQNGVEDDVPVIEDDLNFESCRQNDVKTKTGKTLKANNYLDKIFNVSNAEAKKYLADKEVSSLATCISRSMHHGTNRNANPSCSKDASGEIKPSPIRSSKKNSQGKHIGWNIVNPVPRACASMSASAFMAKRFQMAADCLGIDPKEIFPIINHESHFGATTISDSFAIGAGQIVTENYVDFYNGLNQAKKYISSNHNFFKEAQNFKSLSGYANYEKLPGSKKLPRTTTFFMSDIQDKIARKNPSCEGLKEIYDNPFVIPDSIKSSSNKVFSYVRERENARLCRPKNPDEGLYMAMIYYLTNKKYSQYYLSELNKGIGGSLSSSRLNDWSIILSRYMYNGGAGGVLSVFQMLVRDFKAGKVNELDSKGNLTGRKLGLSKFSSLSNEEFKKYISNYIKNRYPAKNSTRKNEVAKYVTGIGGVGGIEGDLKKIEKEGKGVCGNSY